jgi:general secretion pathway protein H
MPTSARGNKGAPTLPASRSARGFTLLEILVVVTIIAIATAGVTFALRDTAAVQLERDAQRLAALLESARVQSRSSGLSVHWHPVEGGFRFDGLPPESQLPTHWLNAATQVQGTVTLVLGPEPIIGPQAVVLTSTNEPERSVRVATDGLRPFAIAREAP